MFNTSKYTTIYFSIISRAKNQNRKKSKNVYYEKHHIIPKSLSGDNNKNNLVLLTAKEHFICHLLLPKMCDNIQHIHKMNCALNFMLRSNTSQKRYTSKIYEKIKIQHSLSISYLLKGKSKPIGFGEKISNSLKGIKFTDERKMNIKNNHHDVSGENNPMFGKHHTDKTKNKISQANKGKTSGDKNYMFGKTYSDEVKKKISEHSKQKWTPEMKAKMIETRKINKMMKLNNHIPIY